jgi:hypothetical protein
MPGFITVANICGGTTWLTLWLCASCTVAFIAVATMPETRHVEPTQTILT